MTALVLRGIAARKVRAALTALAVLLGVMMVAGTYVLTDTINSSFDSIFEQGSKGVDVKVTPHRTIKTDSAAGPPPFSESLLERVRGVDGVAEAEGGIFDVGSILDSKGKPIQTHGAPNFIASSIGEKFDPFDYVQGRPPANADEVALDKFTADKHDFKIGGPVGILGREKAKQYKLVGIAKYGEVASFGGASVAVVVLPEAQRITDKAGQLDEIDVAASEGLAASDLSKRLRAVMPSAVDVRTGEEQAAKDSADSRESFSFLTTILLVFAGIAVFVGGFIIFNTFSITVSQRKREFGMLRTLGASRRQILGAVFSEAFLIAIVACALGILAGIGYAKGINALFKAVGIDLPSSGTVIESRTIVVAVLVGVVLTLVAAMSPAIRATRVSPLEALREGEAERVRRGRFRVPAGVLLAVVGVGLMLYGLLGVDDSEGALSLIGLGAAGLFIGTAMLSPLLVPPIASVAGAPLEKLRGLTGRLARENAMRNPGRTAVTAAALMIGLALVTFVTVFAAGLKAGVANTIDKNFLGDIILQHENGFDPIPDSAAKAVAQVQGVEAVSPWRSSQARVRGTSGTHYISGLDPATANRVFKFEWKKGSPRALDDLKDGEAVVDTGFADKEKLGIGDVLHVTTPTGKKVDYKVTGAIKDNADFAGDFVIPADTLTRDFGEKQDAVILAKIAEGTPVEPVHKRISALLHKDFPTVEALNQDELKKKQEEQFDQILGLVYALLSLAVIVSIFGIVNTLVLTIHERTRELGLLRAVGMSRRQVRRLVRYESVITAVIGGVLGSILGVLLAVVVSRPLADEGFVLKVPIGSLITFLVLSAFAGVLAAIPPARRASRLDVLEALAYE